MAHVLKFIGPNLCSSAPILLLIAIVWATPPAFAQLSAEVQDAKSSPQAASAKENVQYYEESIQPILADTCFDCHSGDAVEGGFSADTLDPDLINGDDLDWWLEVYSVVSKEEMPPDADDLPDQQRAMITDWLASAIQSAEKFRKSNADHSTFRRLTRYEYNYALQDLLGVPWTFADDLPVESSEETAFENNAESLHMSVQQIETYHKLAIKALNRATVAGDQPQTLHWSIPLKAATEMERRLEEGKIETAKKNLKDKPENLKKRLKSLRRSFQVSPHKSHYLELPSKKKTKNNWYYFGAKYANTPSTTLPPMPEPGSHYMVLQPGEKQSWIVELGDQLPDEGTMRVRVRASRAPGCTEGIASLQLIFGFRSMNEGAAATRVSKYDVPIKASFGDPDIYEWEFPLGEVKHRNIYRGQTKLGEMPNPSEYIRFTNSTVPKNRPKKKNKKADKTPEADDGKANQDDKDGGSSGDEADEADELSQAILIEHVEVSAPVYAQWPPQSHRDLLAETPATASADGTHEESDEVARAENILVSFIGRAWRRPPSKSELDRKLKLFSAIRPSCDSFQHAMTEVLATILSSPKFLYVQSGNQREDADPTPAADETGGDNEISQRALAIRLSLFLWCSLPDQTLLDLAASGRLNDPEVLDQQARRMLADPRAKRFNTHFVQQWLKMRPLDFVTAEADHPVLDAPLVEAMKQEPLALFTEMLEHDSSVLDFIRSDYLVINERLAKHYKIDGVQGNEFRRVSLPAGTKRGGVLTQAGLLLMNSDGKDSHPVKRGVWLLTNLLNDPPPEPPAAVPEIDLTDPKIAEMTLKERIEDHRNKAACLSCHQKIDPWGIAFENFDAFGRWRDKIEDTVVDATSALKNGSMLNGIEGLKQYLMENQQDAFVRATVEKMASFSLGRQLHFGDRAAVSELTQQVRESGNGLKTMVISLVKSPLFRSK